MTSMMICKIWQKNPKKLEVQFLDPIYYIATPRFMRGANFEHADVTPKPLNNPDMYLAIEKSVS